MKYLDVVEPLKYPSGSFEMISYSYPLGNVVVIDDFARSSRWSVEENWVMEMVAFVSVANIFCELKASFYGKDVVRWVPFRFCGLSFPQILE